MICKGCGAVVTRPSGVCPPCLQEAIDVYNRKAVADLKAPAKAAEDDSLTDISEDIAWDAHCERHHETEKALRTEIGRLNLIIADLHAAYCKSEMKASKNKHGVSTLDDTKAISSFSGDYEFLSNFYPSKVQARHDTLETRLSHDVHTVEHAFQAAKANKLEDFLAICKAETPGQAKKLGRKVSLRAGWEDVKLGIMEILLREKFSDRALRGKLLRTGEAVLVEGNTWGDRYWGVCEGVGENHLGRLLMKLRAEFRKAE